jgi:predicted nucleic acid-binding protein
VKPYHGILRQTAPPEALRRLSTDKIGDRIANSYDAAAKVTATISAQQQRRGRPGEHRDSMIAGIALATGPQLTTRDTRHCDDPLLGLLDPGPPNRRTRTRSPARP